MASNTTLAFDLIGRDRSASRTFDKVGRSADTLGDKFKRVARSASRLAAGAGVALGAGLVMATKAAAEEEKEMAILANTLRKTTKASDAQVASTEEWITATQNATGVADGDLRPALGKLVVATGDVSRAQKLLAVAMDVATARGLDLNTVTTAFSKAAMGQVSSLSRLGIKTKDAAGETLTFDQVLQDASRTMGGAAAAAANTASGRFNILRARFADLTEQVGAKLLPILNRLLSWILDEGLPALGRLSAWFNEKVMPSLRRVATYVREQLMPALMEFARVVLPAVRDAVASVRTSLAQVARAFGAADTSSEGFGDTLVEVLPMMALFVSSGLKVVATNVRILTTAFRILTLNLRFVADQMARVISLAGKVKDALPDMPDLNPFNGPFNGGSSSGGSTSGSRVPRTGTAPTVPAPRRTGGPDWARESRAELAAIRRAVTRPNRVNALSAGWAAS